MEQKKRWNNENKFASKSFNENKEKYPPFQLPATLWGSWVLLAVLILGWSICQKRKEQKTVPHIWTHPPILLEPWQKSINLSMQIRKTKIRECKREWLTHWFHRSLRLCPRIQHQRHLLRDWYELKKKQGFNEYDYHPPLLLYVLLWKLTLSLTVQKEFLKTFPWEISTYYYKY